MRTLGFGFFLVGTALFATMGTPTRRVDGCAVIWRPSSNPVEVAAERAIILWEPDYKTQHFIRAAQFRTTTADDFGFLVPTPTRPELAEADPGLFERLEEVTKPREIWTTITQTIPCRGGKFAMVGSAIKPSESSIAPSRVEVLEQKTVGAYQAAVLKANDAAALNTWLATNGYQSRPALQPWLAKYVRNGWILTAFKMKPGANAGTAVRLSFTTEKPFYPYREPDDAKPTAGAKATGRKLKLFLLADVRLKATHDDPAVAWLGHTVWAGKLTAGSLAGLPESLGATASVAGRLNKDWYLTEYEDRSDPRPVTDELSFTVADDQSAMERPPIQRTTIEYVEDCTTADRIRELPTAWWIAGGATAAALAIGLFVIVRKRVLR